MHTFEVDQVTLDRNTRLVPRAPKNLWKHVLTKTNKSWEEEPNGARLLGCSQVECLQSPVPNPLVGAVGLAYNNHYPLSLSPSAVWLTISQGLSTWINENSEAVRKHFVDFEGKTDLEIIVPPTPDWTPTLHAFSERLQSFLGKKRDLFISDFSTSTLVDRMASEVTLMYGMSQYFSYGMRTLCGFPRITLEGSVEDWERIQDRVRLFSEFNSTVNCAHMTEWVGVLQPILSAFVESSKGNVDKSFWRSFYKEGGGSGGPYLSGHITKLFPYWIGRSGTPVRNDYLVKTAGSFGGLTPSSFDRGVSKVDVKWDFLGVDRKVEFHGGFVGISMNKEDYTLRPECGWAVVDVTDRR